MAQAKAKDSQEQSLPVEQQEKPITLSDLGFSTETQVYTTKEIGGMEDAPPPSVPFLKMIQGREADINKEGSVIYHAKPGTLIYTGDNTMAESALFLPVYMHRVYQRWATREPSNSPPIASYPDRPEGMKWKEGVGNIMDDGTHIMETHFWYGFAMMKGQPWKETALALTKTNLKASREVVKGILAGVPAPKIGERQRADAWARPWLLKAKGESNDQYSWFAWEWTVQSGYLPEKHPLYAKCAAFNKKAKEYVASLNYADPNNPTLTSAVNDEIPF